MCIRDRLNSALVHFDTLREPFSDSPILYQILYVTGEIYLKRQEYENARIEFTNVVDSGDPDLAPLALFGIPQAYLAEGKYQEAIDGYQKVIDLYPDTKAGQDAYFYMGWAYERLEKYDEAIVQLQTGIELFPRNENAANAQVYIAQIALANKDITTAVDAFQKVADNATYDYDTRRMAQYSVGKIYEDNGQTDLAVAAYQKLLTEFPEPHREATHQSNNINENYIQTLRSTGL